MKNMTGPLPADPGHPIFLHEGERPLIGMYSVCWKALQWCQPEVITGMSGKVIKMA